MGAIPGRAADPDKQQEQENFRVEKLEPRLAEAGEGKRVVVFMDAAHSVYGAFLGMVWCFVRLFIPSPSGRKRFNVLGALNAVSKEVLTLTNETYINAQSVCQLLLQISQYYGSKPITVVLDNARYQKCALVQAFAAELGIELLFLPSYSPQLNRIERYWRFLRRKCLYSRYYPNFHEFRTAIEQCITCAIYRYPEELESWLAWNFQSFKKIRWCLGLASQSTKHATIGLSTGDEAFHSYKICRTCYKHCRIPDSNIFYVQLLRPASEAQI